jgi:hypothetical protein
LWAILATKSSEVIARVSKAFFYTLWIKKRRFRPESNFISISLKVLRSGRQEVFRHGCFFQKIGSLFEVKPKAAAFAEKGRFLLTPVNPSESHDPWRCDLWLGQGYPVETTSTGISFQVLDSLRSPSAYSFTTSLDGSALVLGEP